MIHLKKIKLVCAVVSLFIFISGCSSAAEKDTYQNIESKEAYELIQNQNPLILDVRTPGEYVSGHIKDAVLIPVQVLATEYIKIIDHREKPIFLYCRSGNRSVTASTILIKNGFKKLYNLKGGINDWVKKGYPIEKNP